MGQAKLKAKEKQRLAEQGIEVAETEQQKINRTLRHMRSKLTPTELNSKKLNETIALVKPDLTKYVR